MKKTSTLKKVSIIGCGYVGSTIAYSIMIKEIADIIVLIDIDKFKSDAESMDIKHGIPNIGTCEIISGTYSDIKDSNLIIIAAGRNRKNGETRLDLADCNVALAKTICSDIKKFYNGGVVLVVTNPVDIITAKVDEYLNLPKGTVFGTGCILDSSRFTYILANYLSISSDVVNAQIIGEHGSSQIAVWSKVTVAGVGIEDYCKNENIVFDSNVRLDIENSVKEMGSRIIAGKGKTHYGIATCVCYLADSILNNKQTIVSVTSVLHGDYGIEKVALSVPSIISSKGVEKTLPYYLNNSEYKNIKHSYSVLMETLNRFK